MNGRDIIRAYVRDRKLGAPCARCGARCEDPQSFDFDHLPGAAKVARVNWMARHRSLEAVKAEMAKCQLLCKPCHRHVTALRRKGLL
jgi:hypothetical protein